MWENDCGALPIVDANQNVVGVITDRDICMAAYTKGTSVWEIPVVAVSSLRVHSVSPEASVRLAEEVMMMHRVRRLVVLDRGGNLEGMLSLADLVGCSRRLGRVDPALGEDQLERTVRTVFRRSGAGAHNA